MNKLKLLSLFSGIGAYEKALENLGISFEVTNYCEIDEYASKAYSLIHNVGEDKNLHDVRLVDITYSMDILTHSFPCTNISIQGKNEGAVKESGTSSSLVYESMRVIKKVMPKIVVCENVTNLLSKKHMPVFNDYVNFLNNLGYTTKYRILNASDFGLAQSRERVFIISILNNDFKFAPYKCQNSCIKDIIEPSESVLPKYYIKDEYLETYVANTFKYAPNSIIRVGTILGMKGHDVLKRVYSQLGLSPTLTTGTSGNSIPKILAMKGRPKDNLSTTLTTTIKDNLLANGISIRKLTPLEYFRLQGFSDEDYKLLRQHKFSDSQLYKLIGNSIAVPVLEYIFKELYKDYVN